MVDISGGRMAPFPGGVLLKDNTRMRREAKKLQKYDSNSIDEEEF